MSYIIAIDPGPTESAYVILDTTDGFPAKICKFGKVQEANLKMDVIEFFDRVECIPIYLAVEMPASYGMAVGASVFNTCAVVGRFEQFFADEDMLSIAGTRMLTAMPSYRVYRKRPSEEGVDSVSMGLCKNNRANDSNVRAAIIDLYPAIGGGKIPQIGSKKEPGPLHGISKDVWAALGVGLVFQQWLEKPF